MLRLPRLRAWEAFGLSPHGTGYNRAQPFAARRLHFHDVSTKIRELQRAEGPAHDVREVQDTHAGEQAVTSGTSPRGCHRVPPSSTVETSMVSTNSSTRTSLSHWGDA